MNYLSFLLGTLLLSVSPALFATSAPQSLEVLQSSQSSISLDWEDVDTAEGYYIYYGTKTGAESSYEIEGVDLIEGSDFVLSGLQAETQYFIAITAIDEFGKESEYSPELQHQTQTSGTQEDIVGNFRIMDVKVLDSSTLELQFNTNLELDSGASRSFIIEDKEMGTELPVDISQVDEGNNKNVLVLLGVALQANTQYKVTVLEVRDARGNTIESGIDAFVDFTTPSFNEASLESAPEEGVEDTVVEETPVQEEKVIETEPVEQVEIVEPRKTGEQPKITPLTGTEKIGTTGNVGVTLSEDELEGGGITKAATKNKKLPQAGPELWFLFACMALFGGAIFLIAQNKKASK